MQIGNLTQLGMLLNISYVRYNVSSDDTYKTKDYPDVESLFIYRTEGLMIGPTVFMEQSISQKFSMSIHSSYLITATAQADSYFYSEKLGIVTDPGSSLSINNTPSQLTLQFNVIYNFIQSDKIEMGLKLFYRYHSTLDNSIKLKTPNIKKICNYHHLGLGINFRLI